MSSITIPEETPKNTNFDLRSRRFRNYGIGICVLGGVLLSWALIDVIDEYTASILGITVLGLVGMYVGALLILDDRHLKWMLIIPSTVVLSVISIIPLFYLVHLSLRRITMINFRTGGEFSGLQNFRFLLFQDPLFWPVLFRTIEYVLITLTLQFLIGLGLALLLNRDFRGQNLISNILLIPIMTTPIVIANLWKYLLNLNNGGINNMLDQAFGLPPIPWLTNQPLPLIASLPGADWLATHLNLNYAFASIVLVNVWQWTPFVFLLLLAGLKSLPTEPLEAARVDGASAWQRLRFVTLPMLRPVISVILLIRLVDLMKVYDQIWALFGNATFVRTLNVHIFTIGITNQNYGVGAALSLIVLMIVLVLSIIILNVALRAENSA